MKGLENYPKLNCGRLLCNKGLTILVDRNIDARNHANLIRQHEKSKNGIAILEDTVLVSQLDRLLARDWPQNTLFVFPGGGGELTKKLSRAWREYAHTEVFAKRFWKPGQDPFTLAGMILPNYFMPLAVEAIVVLDDVISSSTTLKKLHETNAWRFPRAKWYGGAWVSQMPRGKFPSGIIGYEEIFVSVVIAGADEKRVPIVSLSTMLDDPKLAADYAQKHFVNSAIFLECVEEIRNR